MEATTKIKSHIDLTKEQEDYIGRCQFERENYNFKSIPHFMLGKQMKTISIGIELEGKVIRVYDALEWKGKLDEQIIFLIDHSHTPVNWGGTNYKFGTEWVRKYKKEDIDLLFAGKLTEKEVRDRPQY